LWRREGDGRSAAGQGSTGVFVGRKRVGKPSVAVRVGWGLPALFSAPLPISTSALDQSFLSSAMAVPEVGGADGIVCKCLSELDLL
jgi:hypothetical protein